MSPTRQPPPIQIYQDFTEPKSHVQPPSIAKLHSNSHLHMQAHAHPPPLSRPRPQLAPSAMPLQPMPNPQTQPTYPPLPEIYMKPITSDTQHISPLKHVQHTGLIPAVHDFDAFDLMPHMTMPESVSLYTDSPNKRMSLPSSQPAVLDSTQPMTSQSMFTSFNLGYPHFEQENFPMPMPHPDNFADFPDPAQMRRGPLKRSYSESITTNDRIFKKQKADQTVEEEVVEIPQPEDMPPVEDNGLKPPYSYAHMIGMAILRAPGRKLTLANIYDWIATTFKFYRDDPKTGWHNSIRHNLSLNKAFIKQERPKSDAGKGCYWVIKPGMEAGFFKDKPRKNNGTANNLPMQQSFSSQPALMAQPLAEAIQPRPWIVQSQPVLSTDPITDLINPRPQTAPALPELSSDATLPASDPALHEDDAVVQKAIPELAPPSMNAPPSSPPMINSSPPVAPHHLRTRSSPAHVARPLSKHRSGKSITGMNDSGYYSSIESSARASRHQGIMPTSELGFEHTKSKRGRAELEIARIRSSSHDVTPSAVRFKDNPAEPVETSSPIQDSPPKDPTTPSVIFKKPQLPPQSVSPNTQLRRHREAMEQMIGSPVKQDDVFGSNFELYSPTFKLGTPYAMTSFDDSFLYEFTNPMTPLASSPTKATPIKRSVQRNTNGGALSDVTKLANGKLNSKTPSKIPNNITFKAPTGAIFTGSPLKNSVSTTNFEPYNDENDYALFDFGSFPDEGSEEGEELDISKGFSKIGSGNVGTSLLLGKPLSGLKPPLTRSHTTRF